MQNIVEIFKQIQATSSRTDKESILKVNKDNYEFRKILEFLYNPFELTGIKSKKLAKYADFHTNHNPIQFYGVLEAIEYITQNNSGRDEDVKAIANFINEFPNPQVHDFLQDLFTKDFKCGITAKTINKVYGKGTIPEFDVMLAKKYEDEEKKVTGVFYATPKLDGIRCVALKTNRGAVSFFTRQGQEIEGLDEIEAELIEQFPDNYMFDGELLLENVNNLPSDELFRATQKVVRKDGQKKGVEFHLFDSMPLVDFIAGKSSFVYAVRRTALESMFENVSQVQVNRVKLVPVLYKGTDKTEIVRLLDEANAQGKEGIMVNIENGYYTTKRSHVLLKCKTMHTVDLQVIGAEEGSGKNEGTLGALIVDYKGYEVKVGSGFTDAERNKIWNKGDCLGIIGKIIEVQYFEESSNQDGGISLRFPVFKQIRDDKDTPSLY